MIVSVTEVLNYKRCGRMWDWSSFNRQGLQRAVPSLALDIGRICHLALADWLVDTGVSPAQQALKHGNSTLATLASHYAQVVGTQPSDEELQSTYDAIAMAHSMMQNYADFWHTPVPSNLRCIAPEQTVVVPIPGTPHSLEGTLDALLTDEVYVYPLEHKTYENRPRRDTLDTSDQFLAYQWLLSQLPGLAPCGGVAYDGMWKREKPPRGSQLEDLFLRLTLRRNQAELLDYATDLALTVTEMASATEATVTRNRRWEGCYDCGFKEPCLMKSRGEDYTELLSMDYIKRKRTAAYVGVEA